MQPWFGKLAAALALLVATAFDVQYEVPATTEPDARPAAEASAGDGQQREWLYPAYQFENGEKRWGYVDDNGSFVIAPQFERASAFGADGLAIVQVGGRDALVDATGSVVYQSTGFGLSAVSDGLYVEYTDGAIQLIDRSGKVTATVDGDWVETQWTGDRALFSRDGLYGYLRTDGSVAVAPTFAYATSFEDGKAAVKLAEGHWAVIDTAGNRLLELDVDRLQPGGDGMLLYQDRNSGLWGYRSLTGDVSIPPRFNYAMPFNDGLAVVAIGEDYLSTRYGVIDRSGNWVIEPQFGYIAYLGDDYRGEGLFTVARPTADGVPPVFAPCALFNAQGDQLTDFQYYDVVVTPEGVSASDETSTHFLDATGRHIEVNGIGTMRRVGNLIAAEIDGALSYLTPDGQVVWQPATSWTLPGGVQVTSRKYRNGRDVLVYYPELNGLPAAGVQEQINRRLEELFLRDDLVTQQPADVRETVEIRFAVQRVGDVMVVERSAYVFPLGAAHGMPYEDYYHIDLKTGAEYRLSDLFKPGAPYAQRLRDIVRQQIAANPDGGVYEPDPEVKPDQPFAAGADALQIYWAPYEIAPYAAGFPTFTIPYADLQPLIDTEGAFWKALQGM